MGIGDWGLGAELATHLATDLAGNANAVAVIVAHKDDFDSRAVSQAQQKFRRQAVARVQTLQQVGDFYFVTRLEFRPQTFGQVVHVVENFHAVLVNLRGDLFCAKFRQGHKLLLQFGERQPE